MSSFKSFLFIWVCFTDNTEAESSIITGIILTELQTNVSPSASNQSSEGLSFIFGTTLTTLKTFKTTTT